MDDGANEQNKKTKTESCDCRMDEATRKGRTGTHQFVAQKKNYMQLWKWQTKQNNFIFLFLFSHLIFSHNVFELLLPGITYRIMGKKYGHTMYRIMFGARNAVHTIEMNDKWIQ